MTDKQFIPRTLAFSIDGQEERLLHTELLKRPENLIILGEAGSGKTWLLEELQHGGLPRVTARRLMSANPSIFAGKPRLLVDALDEAPAFAEGGVVDQILAKVEQAEVQRLVLACRAEDWQAATSRSILTETYGHEPLELRLLPFDQQQISDFLIARLGIERAREVTDTYDRRGLSDWLGNPQTLSMLAEVAKKGGLPETTSKLFEDYVDLAIYEHNAIRRERQGESSRQVALDTLGAAFAALIVSGRSALARSGAAPGEDDIRLAELEQLPGFADWKAVAGNRLVRTVAGDTDRLTYTHRRIGEWLGARWLSRYATSEAVRDRLLSMLSVFGVVPASLRGLYAWLALDPAFSGKVLSSDPVAVIEYGDADALSPENAQILLDALESRSHDDPWFAVNGNLRAKALVSAGLRPETLKRILDTSRAARLRLLLAKQFQGESLDEASVKALTALALDKETFFALRSDAADALIGNLADDELLDLVDQLRGQGSHSGTRLAARLILEAGIDLFPDERVVETIFATCEHSIAAVPPEGENRMAARVWRYRRGIPDSRLDSLLDLMADYAIALLPKHRSIESSDIINLGDALIARRIRLGDVQPLRLLHWLRAFGGKESHSDEDKKTIAEFLQSHCEHRRAMQQAWFVGKTDEKSFFQAAYELERISRELAFDDADMAAFLESAPADFQAWRAAASMVRHSASEGNLTRNALRRFVTSDQEHRAFVDTLLLPTKPDWLVRQEEREEKTRREREERWAEFRRGMASERAELEQGRFGWVLQAANVYLGRFSDLHELQTPEDRLQALCGRELIGSVQLGFEAYLNTLPAYPNAEQIAHDYARSKGWSAGYILMAALAERVRRTGGLGELTDDWLISAQLHLSNGWISGDEWQGLRDAVWGTLIAHPVAFEKYARLLVEPPLKLRKEFVSGLYDLLHEGRQAHPELVTRLVEEWLTAFPRMHSRPEAELIDALILSHKYAALRPLVKRRLNTKALDEERRSNWQAVALLVDFDGFSANLSTLAAAKPELFWAVRERLGARRPYEDSSDHTAVRLAAWLVEHFRNAFPSKERPNSVTMGDTNAWDATEAIRRLIDRIGSEPTEEAGQFLIRLAQQQDGYQERILAVLAEHRRNRAEQARATIGVESLAAILCDGPPQGLPDLQTKLIALLDKIEAQARSNDTDTWETFFRDDRVTPHGEEYCRNRVIDMLRAHEKVIRFAPEKHLGQDREGDIACEYGSLHLPIEVKGQWHDDLWRAADDQLAAQQAVDHLAGGYGILLVLWFGAAGKKLKGPPRGSGLKPPQTPAELEMGLTSQSSAAGDGRIRVKVLDLSRE